MPTHSRKPRLIYSLTKLYDGRSCLVLVPSLPPPVPSISDSSCSPSTSTSSLSSTPLSNHQSSIQSTSTSAPHRLFQPYPSQFPWSRTIASSHRNLYLYKETRAEIIQRDRRIALREAAYNEFYARMADESRANHVGVTTRAAAAAAVSSIRGENLKRSSRAATRANDSTYDLLDDVDSPPRKKARTTARAVNSNNKLSISTSANAQTTKLHETSPDTVPKPAAADVPVPSPPARLATRSQTKSRRIKRPSPAGQPPNHGPDVMGDFAVEDHTYAEEPALASVHSSEPPTAQDSANSGKPGCVLNESDIRMSQSNISASEEKTIFPELGTPRMTLGRASSTSSTLASSRQSSDDGFRKSDQRFTDGLSLDDDTNVESRDTDFPAPGVDLVTGLTPKFDELQPSAPVASEVPTLPLVNVTVAAKRSEAKEDEGSKERPSQSPPPPADKSGTMTRKAARARTPRKRSHSDEDDVSENHDAEQNAEISLIIPPEVRRSGRVSKKRKLE